MVLCTGVMVCPQCERSSDLNVKRETLKAELEREYGKKDMSGWMELYKEIESLPRGDERYGCFSTLRFSARYGIDKGSFGCSFDAKCDVCGWKFCLDKVEVDLSTWSSGQGVYRYEVSGG